MGWVHEMLYHTSINVMTELDAREVGVVRMPEGDGAGNLGNVSAVKKPSPWKWTIGTGKALHTATYISILVWTPMVPFGPLSVVAIEEFLECLCT